MEGRSDSLEHNAPVYEEVEEVDQEDTNEGINKVKDSAGSSGSLAGQRKRKKSSSKAWDHFERLPIGKDGEEKCKCKTCGKTLSCVSTNGTDHLLRHIDICPKKDTWDIGETLFKSNKGSVSSSNSVFDFQRFREIIASLIAMHNVPFKFVEWEGVRAAFEYLRPGVQTISRNTAKADMLKLYDEQKKRIKSMLEICPGRVSLTSDLWTAVNTNGYIALTAHFIDKEWNLRKYVLSMSSMPCPHTAIALENKIYGLLVHWGIADKVSSLTLDNASANDLCITLLRTRLNGRKALISNGDLFHIRCCAHILNLIVQEGLKNTDEVVEKIRESIRYIRNSQSRKEQFLRFAKDLYLDSKKGLRQDVPTRWNSTFLMLTNALYYQLAFEHIELSDSNFKCCPTVAEWGRAKKLCNFLEPFYELTCLFSGTKYLTSNLYFGSVFGIYLALKDACENESHDDSIRRMAKGMMGKFEKYWSDFNETLAIAVIFYPHCKFAIIEYAYGRLYGKSKNDRVSQIRKRLFDLFDEYRCKTRSTSGPSYSSSQKRIVHQSFAASNVIELEKHQVTGFKALEEFFVNSDDEYAVKSELEVYLGEQRSKKEDDVEILQFWHKNERRFSILSSMARDMLCIPISTVASESSFSCCGHIIDRFRTSIASENAEALLCLRDWIYGEKDLVEAMVTFEEQTADVLTSKNQVVSDNMSTMEEGEASTQSTGFGINF